MKYSTALGVASRPNVKISTLKRIARQELPNLYGREKVRLALAIFGNESLENIEEPELSAIIVRELFKNGGASDMTFDEIIYILPDIICSNLEELFIEFLQENKDTFSPGALYDICERYTLLESDYAYTNERPAKHINGTWEAYVFFE